MSLSMLEQIALRFETYASDQDAMLQRGLATAEERKRMVTRAAIWRDAAQELRKAGADNREAFETEVYGMLVKGSLQDGLFYRDPADGEIYGTHTDNFSLTDHVGKVVNKIISAFITPPIPGPTPRDIIRAARTLRAAAPDVPDVGSVWQHHSSRYYVVLAIANNTPTPRPKYPVTVIYRGLFNGKLWTGPLDDWHRRMRAVGHDETVPEQFGES